MQEGLSKNALRTGYLNYEEQQQNAHLEQDEWYKHDLRLLPRGIKKLNEGVLRNSDWVANLFDDKNPF